MFILYVLIIVAAIIGLSITFNIYKKKHHKQPMVCPFGADCHTVITGNFSSFFGIGLEVYGAAYYAFIATAYALFLISPESATPLVLFIVTGATVAGFLFSLYLTFVQAFLIKSWCSWCLMSAAVSTAIFFFTIANISVMGISFIPLLIEYKTLVLFLHLLAFVLGVGGATLADTMFFKFLKDFKITEKENDVLKTASQVIWVGLFLAIISGIGLYLPQAAALHETPKFLVKVIVVLVIIINGSLLNLLVSPKLVSIAWRDNGVPVKKTNGLRKLAFALGSISFVSWYTALILGFARNVDFAFIEILSMYVGALLIGITGSQFMEQFISKSNSSTHKH